MEKNIEELSATVFAKDKEVQEGNDHGCWAISEEAVLEEKLKLAEKNLLKAEANANSCKAVSEERHKEIYEMKPKLDRLKDLKVNHSELAVIEEQRKKIEEQERKIEELSIDLASTQEGWEEGRFF